MFKEKLSFLTMGTADVRQNGKLIAFGPSTHEDNATLQLAGGYLKDATARLTAAITTGAAPAGWHGQCAGCDECAQAATAPTGRPSMRL